MTLAVQHYVEGLGHGPPLVLGSSLGTTHQMWDAQLDAFSPRLQLVLYDHPGHGASPVPEAAVDVADMGRAVLASLDRLGLERVSYCGLSLGGCVGMWLGANAPERIARLVLACTSPRFPHETFVERARIVREQGMEPIADTVLERWLSAGFPRRDDYRQMLVSTPPEGYARCCEAVAEFDARDYLERIQAPTLVIHGADDPSVTRDDMALLTDRIPESRLVEIPNARHLANVEQPHAFSEAVLRFVR